MWCVGVCGIVQQDVGGGGSYYYSVCKDATDLKWDSMSQFNLRP